jgi:hypothetical protein
MSGAWLALILAVVAPLFAFLGVVATLLFGPVFNGPSKKRGSYVSTNGNSLRNVELWFPT